MAGGSDNSDNKNLILAAVLSMAVVFAWQMLFPPASPPPPEPTAAEGQVGAVPAAPVEGGAASSAAATPVAETRDEALAAAPRIPIASPSLAGSMTLTGGRLDDLHLLNYRESLEPNADTVILLNPAGGPAPYFVDFGWRRTIDSDPGPLPDTSTQWQAESGEKLAPGSPVVLRWENGQGLTFRRKFEVDDSYMFTVTQSVENTTGEAVNLAPYGTIARRGEPKGVNFYIVHEGAIGMFDGELSEVDYDEIRDLPFSQTERGPVAVNGVAEDGWLGFTDKYWMTILAPQPGQSFDAVYKLVNRSGVEEFRTEMRLPVLSIAAGGTVESVTNLFSGAKEVATIRHYQETRGINRFEDAVDWGWFYFLTKPIFRLLSWVHGLIGNMGFSIIVLTFLVKACLFPLAYKSFVSMSKMKKLQPEMEKIKEQCGDDRQKMQQEMMALYKKEKVNPAAGCLPILLQIPIFFSLYKVLFVTIEMRHAPFIGWIHDLSAPDPTTWMNLFGLLDYQIPPFLHIFSIGVYPILMGVTMWLQMKLNPAPTDQTQKVIFAWMPWIFMFMLGGFASGLVIYWCANNIITFTQQYIIMRSQGIEVDLMGNIKSGFKRKPGVRPKPAGGSQATNAEGEEESEAPAPTVSRRAKRKGKRAAPAGTTEANKNTKRQGNGADSGSGGGGGSSGG